MLIIKLVGNEGIRMNNMCVSFFSPKKPLQKSLSHLANILYIVIYKKMIIAVYKYALSWKSFSADLLFFFYDKRKIRSFCHTREWCWRAFYVHTNERRRWIKKALLIKFHSVSPAACWLFYAGTRDLFLKFNYKYTFFCISWEKKFNIFAEVCNSF